MLNIEKFILEDEYLQDIHNNAIYNKKIIEYYQKLYNECSTPQFRNIYNLSESRASRLDSCNKYWEVDIYQFNQIKDFKGTRICKDKFCNNCKKVKQAARMSKYIPEMEQYKDNLYHLTITIPNIGNADLKHTLKKMSKNFQTLIRFISGRKIIKGVCLTQYGYLGAVRSLEVTFKSDNYHPHYHIALVMDNLLLEKNIENKFSIDYTGRRDIRLFSEFEILIQKIWYLLYNNIEVNKYNIDHLDNGYSCIIDKFMDNDYAELFKYMTKGTDEEKNELTYDNFKALYLATHKVKQIQGYGCLYRINDNDLEEEIELIYCNIKELLSDYERPIEMIEKPIDLLKDQNYKIISRKKIYQYLKNIKNE